MVFYNAQLKTGMCNRSGFADKYSHRTILQMKRVFPSSETYLKKQDVLLFNINSVLRLKLYHHIDEGLELFIKTIQCFRRLFFKELVYQNRVPKGAKSSLINEFKVFSTN